MSSRFRGSRNSIFAGRIIRAAAALGALFSGAALLLAILAGVDLRLGLTGLAVLATIVFIAALRGSPPERRRGLLALGRIGVAAGLVATAAYDASRYLLSLLDPSPYNPFEAIRAFGVMLVGAGAGAEVTFAAGLAFHALNGTMFGVSFCLFFGRWAVRSAGRALVVGIGWGLFLEAFQLAIYPGWLDINAYSEFATISAAGHLVYGSVLGLTCRALLLRSGGVAGARPGPVG